MNIKLLDEVKEIIKRNEEEINKTGKGFNLISILNMEHLETRTHSKVIAELLDSKGSHPFKSKFLTLFLEEMKISNFDTSNYEVIKEEYVGVVECSNGDKMRTFLDIVIKDKNSGNVILIENKIWAEDQFEQLERYFTAYKGKIIKLLYLNVFECGYAFRSSDVNFLNESEESGFQNIESVYQRITYETNIKNWLANCIVASQEKPYVSKQIEAYYQTVLKISNQNIYKKMNQEIDEKILCSFENFETASEIANSYNVIKMNIITDFRNELYQRLQDGEIAIKQNINLEYKFDDEDWKDRLYLGFQLVGDYSEEFKLEIRNYLKEVLVNDEWGENNNWLFWIYTNNPILKFNKFGNLTNDELFNLSKNKLQIIEAVVSHFNAIIEKIKKKYLPQ